MAKVPVKGGGGFFGGGFKIFISLFEILKKHWYWVILLLILLPAIITTVQEAVVAQDPLLPVWKLGLRLINADNQIGLDVALLKNNPSELVGMVKPESGLWQSAKYFLLYFWNVVYRTFGNVWLIFFPLVLLRKILRTRNTSEEAKNWVLSIVLFLGYMFVVNLIYLVVGMANGDITLTIQEGANTLQTFTGVTIMLLPFHGIGALVAYLISVFSRV